MDFRDRRVQLGLAATVIVIIALAWALGWFGGAAPPGPPT